MSAPVSSGSLAISIVPELPGHWPALPSASNWLFKRVNGAHRALMEIEPCRICGGDGRVSNAFGGSSTSCPSCRGSGRRKEEPRFRDVTKTKPSHHNPTNKAAVTAKSTLPTTAGGIILQNEIQASRLPDDQKAKLIREIAEYEDSHGRCTDTFCKKIRKQLRGS